MSVQHLLNSFPPENVAVLRDSEAAARLPRGLRVNVRQLRIQCDQDRCDVREAGRRPNRDLLRFPGRSRIKDFCHVNPWTLNAPKICSVTNFETFDSPTSFGSMTATTSWRTLRATSATSAFPITCPRWTRPSYGARTARLTSSGIAFGLKMRRGNHWLILVTEV